MCGRFYIEYSIEDLIASYGVVNVKNKISLKGDIYPGTNIPVIFKDKEKTLDFYRWGFKVKSTSREVINARIETVDEKPTFRKAFYNNRCIIPASAFFEWRTSGKNKTKYKISIKDRRFLSLAGIYERFIDKSNKPYFGVVILTRPANDEMSKIHHRMPVFIKKEEVETWLYDPSLDILKTKENLIASNWFDLNIEPCDKTEQISLFTL